MKSVYFGELNNSCKNCDGTGWGCENHFHLPWDGMSNRKDACGCGAGAPCIYCNELAMDLYVGPSKAKEVSR